MSSSTPDAPGPARSVRPWARLLRIRPENRFTVGVVPKADDRPAAIVVCPR